MTLLICLSVLCAERMVAMRRSRGVVQLSMVPCTSGYAVSRRLMIFFPRCLGSMSVMVCW